MHNWRRRIWILWCVFSFFLTLVGAAGLLDDLAVWRKWLEDLGLAEIPSTNPLVAGLLIGIGGAGILNVIVVRWGNRLMARPKPSLHLNPSEDAISMLKAAATGPTRATNGFIQMSESFRGLSISAGGKTFGTEGTKSQRPDGEQPYTSWRI